jgi:hypothetical protein
LTEGKLWEEVLELLLTELSNKASSEMADSPFQHSLFSSIEVPITIHLKSSAFEHLLPMVNLQWLSKTKKLRSLATLT